MATRLLNKVNEEFHVRLTIRDLFAAPTVYEMAKILDGNERNSPGKLLIKEIIIFYLEN
jgi:hypothetical protein